MQNLRKLKKFFLGANSPGGFLSFFHELQRGQPNWQNFLIKGGPGTGKSSLMKSIANELSDVSQDLELIFCSSDPQSLDALIFNDKKISIVDATAPHILEPEFPGTCEKTISLCDCWNEDVLKKNQHLITDLFKKNSFCLSQVRNLFLAVQGLQKNNHDIIERHLELQNLQSCFFDLLTSESEFKRLQNIETNFKLNLKKNSLERNRFLSTTSSDGTVFFQETITQIAKKIYLIEDQFGVVSGWILSNLKTFLLSNNIRIITCYCPVFSQICNNSNFENKKQNSKIDHILVPDLKIAFVTTNKYHKFNPDDLKKTKTTFDLKTINADDFVNFIAYNLEEQLQFNQVQIKKILKKAQFFAKEAKIAHDKLENCYFRAMDFNLVNLKTAQTIKDIKKILRI